VIPTTQEVKVGGSLFEACSGQNHKTLFSKYNNKKELVSSDSQSKFYKGRNPAFSVTRRTFNTYCTQAFGK
jgi:hypothetical protein